MPDHPFEQLGPDRFQHFCQALLTEKYPGVQCLPVGQPDGGRDAFDRFDDSTQFLAFQVKFARQPGWIEDPEKWIEDVLDGEREKIAKLSLRGAKEYILLTNLSASAHLDVGAVDRVQKLLDGLPLPASCWWRDDLNRRLEGSWNIKLSYPELFTGPDFLRVLIERDGNGEDGKRRRRAVRAYLADQLSREREVRFKQADLINQQLLDVFIDVPAGSDIDYPTREGKQSSVSKFLKKRTRGRGNIDLDVELLTTPEVGTGTLLLEEEFAEAAPRSVVEGAPGQGKSTVLQYVSQVHRLRLLDHEEATELSKDHRLAPVRLPFKVDLRDLAQWLQGIHPSRKQDPVPLHLRTLEGFLAGQVISSSGGADFSVSDLQAVVSDSPVFLALDGLDEVADPQDRMVVVEAICDGVDRLEAVASSLLTVVTSRPASFVGAVGLPRREFPIIRLQSLTQPRITEYAEKWMDVRELEAHEREELTSTLDTKLSQPHIRDLAHNPMQLAILLNLIHRRGPALPDQRTALYSSYMEQFLDREAEKSRAVRDHRKLLTTLHGYLAWLLHCQAENSADGGRFTTEDVRNITGDFLEAKGYGRDLFGDLFGGVFDRVGALVSRIQGTYEFEVQPLREFFAAQFLYQTAPYSVAGDEKTGTRPERLEALSRHPYWLNVTRFYAGSYDVGELSSLADHLEGLHETEPWVRTAHPRTVAARLLADWTFQQDLKIQDRVVDLLKKDLGERGGISQRPESYGLASELRVPEECGGDQLAKQALEQLREESSRDRRYALGSVINVQVPEPQRRRAYWIEGDSALRGNQRALWIRSVYQLGLSKLLRPSDVAPLSPSDSEAVAATLFAELFEVFDRDPALKASAIKTILDEPSVAMPAEPTTHPLPALAAALLVERGDPASAPRASTANLPERALEDGLGGYEDLRDFLETAVQLKQEAKALWRTQLQPWNRLVEAGRKAFGDCPAIIELAVIAAGVASREERGGGHRDFFDEDKPLCQRLRYARMRTGNVVWWQEVLSEASTPHFRLASLGILVLWAGQEVFEANSELLLKRLQEMDPGEQEQLLRLVQRAAAARLVKTPRLKWTIPQKADTADLVFALVGSRLDGREALDVYAQNEWFMRSVGISGALTSFVSYELQMLKKKPGRWRQLSKAISEHYGRVGWQAEFLDYALDGKSQAEMPLDVALEVTAAPRDFPLSLISKAEARCLADAQDSVESVAAVAERDGWFDSRLRQS